MHASSYGKAWESALFPLPSTYILGPPFAALVPSGLHHLNAKQVSIQGPFQGRHAPLNSSSYLIRSMVLLVIGDRPSVHPSVHDYPPTPSEQKITTNK